MTNWSDGPQALYIGNVGPIPVRGAEEAERRKQNAAVADSLHSPEELQRGLLHHDPDVRWRVVSRLVARGRDHPSTVPALLQSLQTDTDAGVRDAVAMALLHFPDPRVVAALEAALHDVDADVRDSAAYSLRQLTEQSADQPPAHRTDG